MRTLNLEEFSQQFNRLINRIELANPEDTTTLIDHLFFFIQEQSISKRIVERIEFEFKPLKLLIDNIHFETEYKQIKEIKSQLKSDEIQGAFSLFLLNRLFNSNERKYNTYYIELGHRWYNGGGDYYDWQNKFNLYFLSPLFNIVEWYCYESHPKEDGDYFSLDSRNEVREKLNQILLEVQKQGFANQIIFEEIEELSDTLVFLKKEAGCN